MSQLKKIGLGGGCHWCTEGVFVSLVGVHSVEQGWIASDVPDDVFAEAVIVHYDPEVISAEDLITVHLETHAATSNHPLRKKYRSAIYWFEEGDRSVFSRILSGLAEDSEGKVYTRIYAFRDFRPSLPEHQDYYRTNPDRPFCLTYISPKLKALRERRPELMAGDF